MSLALSDEHRALAEVARSFVTASSLRQDARAALSADYEGRDGAWRQICHQGWTGLHLPERVGGQGYGVAELAVVVEAFGAVAAPGPFLPAVIGSAILGRLDESLVAPLANGSSVAGFGIGEVHLDDQACATGSGILVLGAQWADHLVVTSGPDVAVIAADDPGVRWEPTQALDPALGVGRLTLTGARARVLADGAAVAVGIARSIAAAEAAGGARAALTMALDYAKVREQFGRTIGSFQAVKHHLADMLIDCEQATAAAWDAARAVHDQAELAGAVAATVAFEAYRRVAQLCIQVHGGIGFTWEHDAHLYLRRAITLQALLGRGAEADVLRLTAAGARLPAALDLPPEADTYRTRAQAFLAEYAGAPPRAALVDSGYLVPHWAPPWGRGADAVEQLVIEQEFAGVEVPGLGIGGWNLLTISQHGTPEQIERWIRPGLLGRTVWCQLFSEPGAGSDAAAVSTRAARVAGGWRITGQKVWTSGAHHCDLGLATVRTNPDAPKHRGITAVVVSLRAPGVEVRPLRQITGGSEFNEVFFDDVFVPDADVVGDVDAGWTVARATLGNERVSIGGTYRTGSTALDLIELLRHYAPDDAGLARAVGAAIAAEQVKRAINLRQVARAVAGAEPGPEGNVTKQLIADQAQARTELALRILGPAGVDGSEPTWTRESLAARGITIAGGTSEIARNVIAERILGLPRDPLNR